MNEFQQKIEEIVSQAVTEKTFSLEIIEKIRSLKETSDAEIKKTEQLTKINDEIRIRNVNLDSEVRELTKKLTDFETRETEIAVKEKQLDRKDYELTFQINRANEIKELFSIVFKNPIIKEIAHRNSNVPVAVNGYVQQQSGSENEEKIIETQ